jgi:hypothetical protein
MVPDSPTEPGRFAPEPLPALFLHAGESGSSPPDEPVVEAIRNLMAKRLPEAVHALEHYDKPNQEALLMLLPWVARLGEGSLTQAKPQEVATFLDVLENFSRALRPRAALSLGKVCFCQDIRGFGLIDPLPNDYAFQAGGDSRYGERMLLYVEVRNFASRQVGQFFETRLAGRVEIRDAQGKPEWSKDFEAESNVSVSPRHDYFIIFRLWVPPLLPAGHHTLVVEVSDETGQIGAKTPSCRIAHRSLSFDVTGGELATDERR